MKKRKKRPDLNTTKAEAGTFFPGVQKKLAIGKADNAYEIEADNMADTLVNATENSNIQKKGATEEVQQKPLSDAITPIQKKEMTEEEPIQKQEMVSEEEPVQKMEEEHE